jgi:AcrR family transcriptional regulator
MVGPPPPEHLAERLVLVALDLLAEQGLDALTLRHIARRAGVSHGAPLRHFRSRGDLLAEVAARGFQVLSESIGKSVAQLGPEAGSRDRLRAGARAYVESAVARPGLFALMFRPELLDAENASYLEHGTAAFDQLLVQVRAAHQAGWHIDRDPRLLAGGVWAALYGLASLWAQGAFAGPVPGVTLDDAIDTTLDLMTGDLPSGDLPGGIR